MKIFHKISNRFSKPSFINYEDSYQSIKIGYYALVVTFLSFIAWATFVELDQGIPCQGVVVVAGKNVPLQHKYGGILQHVYIKEGEHVKKGQLLIQLKDSQLRTTRDSLKLNQAQLLKQVKATEELAKDGLYPKIQFLDLQKQLDDATIKLALADDELKESTIYSPINGQIFNLQIANTAGFIQPGQKISEIVPNDEALIFEIKINPSLIDHVKEGAEVDIRFSNFLDTPRLVTQGILLSVSNDIITENQKGMPYYEGRVAITEDGKRMLGNKTIQPGMHVDVVVRTGKRTLLTYITKPLVTRISQSLKEN